MKYFVALLTACLISITFSVDAEAQILNRIKKKAQDAAERKTEQKITERVERAAEQMVERSWNSIFGEMPEDSTSGMRLPFRINSNITTEDEYNFKTIVTMEVETINEDGEAEPPLFVDMHFSENEMYTGTKFESEEMNEEEGDLFMIYDFKNSAMLMLMQNEEDKFSFAYKWEQIEDTEDQPKEMESEGDSADLLQEYSKIGTKEILGYHCEGYRSETETENTEIWVSRDADFGMHNWFRANANTKQLKGKIPEDYPQGAVMEMNIEDLESGDTTTMKVVDINKDAQVTYMMSDYPTMSFGENTQQD